MYLNELNKEKYILIEADNPNYQYSGRVDFENSKAPTIIYAGSMIKTKFTGKSLKIAIKNIHACYENAIGFIIDGNITGKVIIEEHNKNIVLDVAEGLSAVSYTHLDVYKRQIIDLIVKGECINL